MSPLFNDRDTLLAMSILDYFRVKTKARLLRGEHVHWIHDRKDGGKYIEQCVLSFPPWADRKELQALWQQCRDLEKATGKKYTLGHIVPLRHPRVCGLSVPWNLQPEPATVNFSKGNAWCEHHGDLFSSPEQLSLI